MIYSALRASIRPPARAAIDLGFLRNQGPIWSPEKVVNGNFASGMSGWNSVGGPPVDTSGGTCRIGPSAGAGGYAQDIAVPVNTPIDVHIIARRPVGSSAANVFASPSASYSGNVAVTSTAYQDFYWRLVSTTGAVRLYLQVIGGDAVLEVQSASVKWLLSS